MFRKALDSDVVRMNGSTSNQLFLADGHFRRLGLRGRCKGGDLGMLCQIPPGQLRRLPGPPRSLSGASRAFGR